MDDENEIAPDERNQNKKLVKRGFLQPEISRYIRDDPSDNYNTNKQRMMRIMFLANQLARDAGVELLIFGYFPNVAVGSCGAWAFGEETDDIVTKPTAKSFLKHRKNVFSLKEDIRQNPEKAAVDVDVVNEESEAGNVESNKEAEGDGVYLSHTDSEGENVESTNKVSEAGGVESSNTESESDVLGEDAGNVECVYLKEGTLRTFEPKQEQVTSLLISGTQHDESSTITLTHSEDGTYLPPANLIAQLDAWGLSGSDSLIINSLAPSSEGQMLLEIGTESTSDRTGQTVALNVSASELPAPVYGTKQAGPVQRLETTPVELNATLTPFVSTSTQSPATAISTEQPLPQPLTEISLKAGTTSNESQILPSGSLSGLTAGGMHKLKETHRKNIFRLN